MPSRKTTERRKPAPKRKPAKKRRKGGRPSKRTPARALRITEAIAAGHSCESAAGLGGIAPSTFYEWCSSDPEFAEAVERARAKSEYALVEHVLAYAARRKGSSSLKAAIFLLERRWPERYGRIDRAKVQVTDDRGKPGEFVDTTHATLTELEELRAFHLRLRERAAAKEQGDVH